MEMVHAPESHACWLTTVLDSHTEKWKQERPLPFAQLRISGWHQTAGSSACPAEVALAVLEKQGPGYLEINLVVDSVYDW